MGVLEENTFDMQEITSASFAELVKEFVETAGKDILGIFQHIIDGGINSWEDN